MISKTPKGSPSQVASRAWCCSVSFASINRAQHTQTQADTCVSAHWAWLWLQPDLHSYCDGPNGPNLRRPQEIFGYLSVRCMQISTEKFPIPYPNLSYNLETGAAAKVEAGAGAEAVAVAVAVAGAWPADMDYAGSITIYSALNRKSTTNDSMWQVKNWFAVSFVSYKRKRRQLGKINMKHNPQHVVGIRIGIGTEYGNRVDKATPNRMHWETVVKTFAHCISS